MISLKEYLGPDWKSLQHFLPIEHQQNIDVLLDKLNRFRAAYAKPMIVTSGYRTKADHLRIYKAKRVPESKIPWGSKHLSGQACDFADTDGSLKQWVRDNESLVLNSFGLWCEHWKATDGWLHAQSVPYGSWKKGDSLWFWP